MKFDYDIIVGIFKNRPNRFIGIVEIEGKEEICHIPNTGRMKELLYDGVKIGLSYHDDLKRKTKYEMRLVEKNGTWYSIDSQLPNKLAMESIKSGEILIDDKIKEYKSEHTIYNSRFDIYLEGNDKWLIEVKGVTLENDGLGMFPDAPTTRGAKHVSELTHSITDGFRPMVIFICQTSDIKSFTPNSSTDEKFSNALLDAHRAGVLIKAYSYHATLDGVYFCGEIPVNL